MPRDPGFTAPLPFSSASPRRPETAPRRPNTMVLHPRKPTTPPHSDPITSTLSALHKHPVVLCIRMTSPETALRSAQAALDGGLRCIEVAMTTPQSASIISSLRASHPHALIGAGTVLTPHDVATASRAGASFALSPVTDPNIIHRCHESGMLAVPGAATPTECWNAYQAGAKLVKIFPINLYGGLDFVKAMQGPLSHIPLLPTSGIDAASLPDYLSAPNVYAIGASRQILPKEAIAAGQWQVIAERAGKWAAIAAEHRHST